MSEITLTVHGAPVPKGRPRMGKGGNVYTPSKTVKYETSVQREAQIAMAGREPFDVPLALRLTALLPIPQSWSKKKQERAAQREILPSSRPDLDNFLKAALDGMNKIVFRDDSQVVVIAAMKFYDARPRLEIQIEELRA